MSYPPIPPLPPDEQQQAAPTLPPVLQPNALQALSGLFLLAQSMPQLLPQAGQQLQTQREQASEREIAQYELQARAQERQAAQQQRQFENAQRNFEAQMKILERQDQREQARLDEEFRGRQEQRAKEAFDLQKSQAKLQKTEFDATAARLLGDAFNDALKQVDATVLDAGQRAKLLSDLQTNVQYQTWRAKDQIAADRWLQAQAGVQLTQTERMRRATEIVLTNPGTKALFEASGLRPEDVFRAELLPADLPTTGPEAEALQVLTDIALRRAMGGTATPEQEAQFATAMKALGGTEAVNKISDDLARFVEVKYGKDRDQFEAALGELIDIAAGPEHIALAVPSETKPAPTLKGVLGKVLHRSKEREIADIQARLKSPQVSERRKADLRKRLAELETGKTSRGATGGY